MDFGKLFIESKGRPIQYNGRELFMIDTIQCERGENIFRLTFDETNSNWKQGVRLNVNGFFEINSQKVKSKAILWQDTAPGILEFKVFTKEGFFQVYNAWDTGNGSIDAWHNGAAMYSENIPNGKRYYCNDGYPDDDFNDLIFTLEKLYI